MSYGLDSSTDRKYLRQLLHTAEEYISYAPYDRVQYFYRNKPTDYFDEVKRNNNTLMKIRKDQNGDQRSPINGKLSGVFLNVSLWQGRMPTASPFGSTRVRFPIAAIFKDTSNLYFTDFYCTRSENHYVTLVLTPSGSQEDVFCSRSLIELDPETNMFLRRSSETGGNTMAGKLGDFTTVRGFKLHVEIFYTENVPLDTLTARFGPEHVFYDHTGIIGKGTSTWGGLRKNTLCVKCNPSSSAPEVTQSETKRKRKTVKAEPRSTAAITAPRPAISTGHNISRPAISNSNITPRTPISNTSYDSRPPTIAYQPRSSSNMASRPSSAGRYVAPWQPEATQPRPSFQTSPAYEKFEEEEDKCCGKVCCIIM